MRKSKDDRARGFVVDLSGDLLMKIYTSNDAEAEPVSIGILKGDGDEKEVLLKDYDSEVYIELIPYSDDIDGRI